MIARIALDPAPWCWSGSDLSLLGLAGTVVLAILVMRVGRCARRSQAGSFRRSTGAARPRT
jgi:hypothetical protein